MSLSKKRRLNRRSFMRNLTCAGAGALAVPMFVPARALGATRTAASNRITMGCIGMGGMGRGDMGAFLGNDEVQVVAVCDVDENRLEQARREVDQHYSALQPEGYKGCAAYKDFREVIARDDIDTIMMATPDHWHALVVCEAARAGKDIYGEKPLSLTIEQGRIMSDTVRRYGRVFQTGSQQRSSRQFRFACELVRNGRIGKLKKIYVGLPGCKATGILPAKPAPEELDYDFWLGPAPWEPYHDRRCHWNFRYNYDYSGGHVTDWGAHHCDIAQWGMGSEYSGPVEVEGEGVFPEDGAFNVATSYTFTCTYADGIQMICSSGFEQGVKFEGTEGWLFVSRSRIDASPKSLLTSVIGPNEIHLYKSDNHHADFIECVKSRREPVAPIEQAHRTITVAHLGNIALLLGRKIRWNPQREEFVNDPEAERCFITSRAMRSPWGL